jgi:Zn-dependent peptidase ImmA (M78 family)/transcriptional regulator with XRE-family HTH domain
MTTTALAPTRETIATRVKLAREQAHATQEAIANHLGIPRPSVSEIEAGRRDLSSTELAALSDYLKKPMEWFLATGEQFAPDSWNPERFRLRGGHLEDGDRAALLDFARRSLEYAELEELVGLRPSGGQVPPPRYRELSGRHIDQGRAVAEGERARLRLGSQPIGDVVALLERQGIKVLDWQMPDTSSIDGALFASAETGPSILLNKAAPSARRQFTAAHEYAHLLFDLDGDQAEVCFRGGGAALAEKRANAFAAEFLSPTSGVLEFLETRGVPKKRPVTVGDVVELQRYFNVSYEATLWRLLNLGLIDADEREDMAQFRPSALIRELGFQIQANGDSSSSNRFASLAFGAWQAGKITRGKLAELLGVTKAEVEDLTRSAATLGAA